jgi:hypothetical protein
MGGLRPMVGKDSIASAVACVTALRDWRRHLRPGERASVVCLACDRDQARIVHGYIRGYFETIPLLQPLLVRTSDELLELANNVDIIVSTNSFRAVRGRTVVCAILDEVAYYSGERSASPDTELHAALVPAMVRVPGSMLIGISSPYRRAGLLYNRYQRHYGTDSDVLVVRGPTPLFNPLCPQHVIDEALAEDREKAGAEWLAEWRSDLADFLDRELVESAVDPGVTVRPPVPGRLYCAFADPSGGRGSSFACAVVHAEGDGVVLDALLERAAPFDPSGVVAELAEVLRSYSVATVVGDKYAAGWVTEGFAKAGIRYQASDRDRSSIYLDALPLFASGRVRLIDSVRLVHQLTTLERRVSSFGRDRVGPAERIGAHDDAANAVSGALVLAASDARGALIPVERMLPDGVGVPMPSLYKLAFAVVVVSKNGMTGCIYSAYGGHIGHPLTIVDFDCGPMTPTLFANVYERLAELAGQCPPRRGPLAIFVEQAMQGHAEAQIAAVLLPRVQMGSRTVWDVSVEAVPKEWLRQPEQLAHDISGHVIGGAVHMTASVVEKCKTSPFAGALQFRSGDKVDDPLRLAFMCGIAVALADPPSAKRAT